MLDVPGFQHAASLGVAVCVTIALDRSTQWLKQARAEDPYSPFIGAEQCSRRRWSKDLPVANVGVRAFSTLNAVHYYLSVVCLNWVLGVHRVLPQGPEGTEGDLNG